MQNLVGHTFGDWNVLEKVASVKARSRFKCQCKCGFVKELHGGDLRAGRTLSCRSCSDIKRRTDLVGLQVGEWKVLEHLGKLPNRGEHTYYRCICSCGNEAVLPSTNLVRGKTTSCRHCSYSERKGIWQLRLAAAFSRVKINAKNRGIEFNLSHEYVLALMEKQEWKCVLTGLPLEVSWGVSKLGNSTVANTVTTSLDRIDPKKGYIEGNVQWLYKAVNMMKWKLTQAEFIQLCKLIAERN